MEAGQRPYDAAVFADELNAAEARIQRNRTGDCTLRVLDRRGQPVANAEFGVQQTRSHFNWGEQLWGLDTLFRHGYADSDRVRHFTELFTDCLNSANCLTYWTEAPRNDGPKHMEFQGEDKLDGFAAQVNWALHNGLTPKGHPIFWSLPKAYPSWLSKYPIETQWKFIEVRVRNLVARFRGKVKIWDLVNEAMWEPAPKNLPHRHWPHMETEDNICEYIIPVMRWAREEDPDALFIVNDYGMELDGFGKQLTGNDGSTVNAKSQRDRYTALVRRLAAEGAAPDGIGMQAHTGSWLTPTEQVAILDDFATAGVPLHYTEFWAHNDHLLKAGIDPATAEQMKADYIAQVMTVAYAHPNVAAFYFWGDINGSFGFKQDHNSNGIPTSSNKPTVVYHKVRELLRRRWWTQTTARTDGDGVLRFNGFFGDYSLRYHSRCAMPYGVPFAHCQGADGVLQLRCLGI